MKIYDRYLLAEFLSISFISMNCVIKSPAAKSDMVVKVSEASKFLL